MASRALVGALGALALLAALACGAAVEGVEPASLQPLMERFLETMGAFDAAPPTACASPRPARWLDRRALRGQQQQRPAAEARGRYGAVGQ
jgi:hypothetical protein